MCHDWFQSLLCWIVVRDEVWRNGLMVESACFNPCCVGLLSETMKRLSYRLVFMVSILVVLDCCQRPMAKRREGYCRRVSILVVLDCCQRLALGLRFLFYNLVSILVVLDCCQRQPPVMLAVKIWCCFNPCCVGLLSETTRGGSAAQPRCRFNPCCVGLLSETI